MSESQKSGSPAPVPAKVADEATRAIVGALATANLCTRAHAVSQRKLGPPQGNPVLAERMREAIVTEPDPTGCPDCAARLSIAASCLLAASLRALGLKGGPSDFVRAALALKGEQPMAWSAVDKLDAVGVFRAFDRVGIAIDHGKLQNEVDAIARVVARKAA